MKKYIRSCLVIALGFAIGFGAMAHETDYTEDEYQFFSNRTLIEWYVDWKYGEDLTVVECKSKDEYIYFSADDANGCARFFGSISRSECDKLYRRFSENG